jgi:hypothetical protein
VRGPRRATSLTIVTRPRTAWRAVICPELARTMRSVERGGLLAERRGPRSLCARNSTTRGAQSTKISPPWTSSAQSKLAIHQVGVHLRGGTVSRTVRHHRPQAPPETLRRGDVRSVEPRIRGDERDQIFGKVAPRHRRYQRLARLRRLLCGDYSPSAFSQSIARRGSIHEGRDCSGR